jgi:hypothetical protein
MRNGGPAIRLLVLYKLGKICNATNRPKGSAYLVQRPCRAEYLSGEHCETNCYDKSEIEVEMVREERRALSRDEAASSRSSRELALANVIAF